MTAGDPGAVRASRAAANMVSTPRAMGGLASAGVAIDVFVASSADIGESYGPETSIRPPRSSPALPPLPAASCSGPMVEAVAGRPRPCGPAVDAYGSGDSFAAGLTYGLGTGNTAEQAVESAPDAVPRAWPEEVLMKAS